ncbi:hypothetical protein KAH37_03825 [bacterium]|nr:hypothetical protein [bacterium]
MQRLTMFFTLLILLTLTLYADYDAEQGDVDTLTSDADFVAVDSDLSSVDEDVADSDNEIADSDTVEPNYDDYNFPDVTENTDRDAIKTERIKADGCSLLFL